MLGNGETAENKTGGNLCSPEIYFQIGHSSKLSNVTRVSSLKFYDNNNIGSIVQGYTRTIIPQRKLYD